MVAICASLALLVTGIAAIAAADRRRDASTAVGFLRELDRVPEVNEFRTLLEQPVRVRILVAVRDRIRRSNRRQQDSRYRRNVRRELTLAGLDRLVVAEVVIAAQVAGAVVGVGAGLLFNLTGFVPAGLHLVVVVIFAAAGSYAPRSWIARRGRARSAAIGRDLPDLLELVAIGISAGLGVDPAIDAVVSDFDGPIAEEFNRYLDDVSLGTSRRAALDQLRERTDVRSLAQFAVTLAQADDMGMPISSILRSSAADARQRRQQEARERAAKLPVKMLIPLVLFVFPPLLVIIMGPAVSTIMGAFG